MLIVAAVVIGAAGFAVYRLHGLFGSHITTATPAAAPKEISAFSPKDVRLEVFGNPGSTARGSATPTSTPTRR